MNIHVDIDLFVGGDIPLRVAFTARPGEVLLVTGTNGSGKTTLLRALLGLVCPVRGEVRCDDDTWSKGPEILVPSRSRGFGYAPQSPTLLPGRSVGRNIDLGAILRGLPARGPRPIAGEWIEQFGLRTLRERLARDLSGGEAARTNLARAFASHPRHLALDEPLAHLAKDARPAMIDAISRGVHQFGGPHFIVTHHPEWFASVSPRRFRMKNHRLIEEHDGDTPS